MPGTFFIPKQGQENINPKIVPFLRKLFVSSHDYIACGVGITADYQHA